MAEREMLTPTPKLNLEGPPIQTLTEAPDLSITQNSLASENPQLIETTPLSPGTQFLLDRIDALFDSLDIANLPEAQDFWSWVKGMAKTAEAEALTYLKLNLLITEIVEAQFKSEGYELRAVPLDILIESRLLPIFIFSQFVKIPNIESLAQEISKEIIPVIRENLDLFIKPLNSLGLKGDENESLILATLFQAVFSDSLPEELQAQASLV